jgi:ankyrin repeat protein
MVKSDKNISMQNSNQVIEPDKKHLIGQFAYVLRQLHEGKALIKASAKGDVETAQALLAGGANPNFKNANGQTPLMFAAAVGHSSVVKILLNSDADPNVQDEMGRTALMYAAGAPLETNDLEI